MIHMPVTLELATPFPRLWMTSKAQSPMHHTQHCLNVRNWRKLGIMFVQHLDRAIKGVGPMGRLAGNVSRTCAS